MPAIRRIVTDPVQYPQYWQEIINIITAAQYEIDERPCFEHYHHYDDNTGTADVSFHIPLKA